MKKSHSAQRLLKRIEDEKFSFLSGFISLFAIIYLRNFFESVFEGTQILGFSPLHAHSFYMVFVHFPLFYFSLFAWILLLLALFTGENWTKVARFLLVGMAVITIVPFIDILVSKGSGYRLTYLRGFEEFAEIHRVFVFTRDLLQASWGQRIEILLVIAGSLGYLIIKTRNILKSLIGSILVYFILFLHGVLPNTIAKIPTYLGLENLHFRTLITNGILPIDSQNYAVVFSLLIILAGIVLFRKNKKELNRQIFDFARSGFDILFLCLGMLISSFLLARYYHFILSNPLSYLIFALAICTITLAVSAARQKHTSLEFQLPAIGTVFFSLTLGPLVLLFISLTFVFRRFLKPKLLSVVPSFLAGFFVIYHGNSLKTALPIYRNTFALRGRALSGWHYFLNQEYEKALNQYEMAHALSEGDEYTKRIAQCHGKLGDLDRAIELLSSIANPDYETFIELGNAYTRKGDKDRAIELYEAAIQRNVEQAEFSLKVAEILSRGKDWNSLEESLERCLLYGNPRYKTLQIRGDFHMANGNQEKAFAMYSEALRENPRSVKALAGTGIIYYNRQEYGDAEQQLKRALEIEPDNDALLNNLGALYLMQQKNDEAIRLFQRSLRKNPNQPEAHFNLGLIYERMGRKMDALAAYRKALKVNPSYLPARKRIEELNQ
jgi:tetratricopeptide (TPR) repeat protein